MKKILTIVLIIFMVVLSFILGKIAIATTNSEIPQERRYDDRLTEIKNWTAIRSLDNNNLRTQFPFALYLDSCNYYSVVSIKHDLATLDSLFGDADQSRETLSIALTEKLESRFATYLQPFNPDSLLLLLQWAERFKYYGEAEPSNKIFYESVYGHWTDKITGALAKESERSSSVKYDFKFRYLQTRCVEQRVSPAIKKRSTEKAFENLIYNKWGHLINASWQQSSLLQKMLFVLTGIIFLTGVVFIIHQLIQFTRKLIRQ